MEVETQEATTEGKPMSSFRKILPNSSRTAVANATREEGQTEALTRVETTETNLQPTAPREARYFWLHARVLQQEQGQNHRTEEEKVHNYTST